MTDNTTEVMRIEIAKLEIGPRDILVISTRFRNAEDYREFMRHAEETWGKELKGRIVVMSPETDVMVLHVKGESVPIGG